MLDFFLSSRTRRGQGRSLKFSYGLTFVMFEARLTVLTAGRSDVTLFSIIYFQVATSNTHVHVI